MTSGFWLQYTGALLVVALLLGGLYAVVRGFARGRVIASAERRLLTVLESTMLSQHAAVHVVKVGKRYVMIGASNGNVSMLGDLPSDEVETWLTEQRSILGAHRASLLEAFKFLRGKTVAMREQLARLWERHQAFLISAAVAFVTLWVLPALAGAQTAPSAPSAPTIPIPNINIGVGQAKSPSEVVGALQILLLLTVLSLAPTLLVMVTSFTRIICVLSFVRTAMGTQSVPPNQVLAGLALLLTFFIMQPVINDVNKNAVQPYLKHQITQSVAIDKAAQPLRVFMFKQTREKDIQLFYSISKEPRPKEQKDVPTYLLIPAFVLSELKTAFEIGFAIYIPFIVVDMVIASILLSMGMMMIPPIIISLPFKILIFILVDGWDLTVSALFQSFHQQ